jgi:hypothetical protein
MSNVRAEQALLRKRLEDHDEREDHERHDHHAQLDGPAPAACECDEVRDLDGQHREDHRCVEPPARVRLPLRQVAGNRHHRINTREVPGAAHEAMPAGSGERLDEQPGGNQDGVGDERVDVVEERRRHPGGDPDERRLCGETQAVQQREDAEAQRGPIGARPRAQRRCRRHESGCDEEGADDDLGKLGGNIAHDPPIMTLGRRCASGRA